MKHFKKCTLYFLIGIIFLELCFLLGLWVGNVSGIVHSIDLGIAKWFASVRSPGLTTFMSFMTHLGDYEFVLHFAGIAALLAAVFSHLEIAVGLFAGLAFTSSSTGDLKSFFHRLRPDDFSISHAGGWSYPSGHMSGISIVCIMVIWAALAAIPNVIARRITIAFAVLLAFLVGTSRMYLGVHWFSDVLGGLLLALGIALIFIGFLKGAKCCVRGK